ncbi:MAG: restriction endonuclease subunit S [Coriobacteriia bacterium]|nr:restriction endonuclease subunit S [Coriobacteriia bacterium]
MKWPIVKFGELYSEDSRNGLTKPSKIRGEGYKMVNMGELFSNDYIYDIPMELVPLTDKEKQNAKLRVGDLLFARQSLVLEGAGKCSIVMDVSPITVFESHIIRVRLNKKANPLFYFYYFNSSLSPIRSIVNQCAQAGIRASDLKNLNVIHPPLDVQNKIVEILSKYDNLLFVSKKQINILEEVIQRLYKEWFVKLHFPGYKNTMINDGVPYKWFFKPIKDICVRINAGGTPSRKKRNYWEDPTVKWFKTGELQDCFVFESDEMISIDGLNGSSAKLFPENTILMAIYASPTLGRLGILTSEAACNQAALCLLSNEEIVSWQWLYLKLYELRDEFNAIAKGAGQQNISANVVKSKEVLIPSKKIMDDFTALVKPIFKKRKILQNQIILLVEARDRLLTKLMNGEISV